MAPSAPVFTLRRPRIYWKRFLRKYRRIPAVRWLLLGVAAGVVSGLLAVLFYLGVEVLKHLWQSQWAGLTLPSPAGERLLEGPPGPFRPWVIPILTTLVGLFTGFLVQRFIPETEGAGTDGTDSMVKAFHRQAGRIRPLIPLIKSSTAILTIAAGGSAGREGPISLLGAGMGSWLANVLKLSARERRILLLAGAAGGLGAIFRAPLGGALTAVEVIYSEDFEAEAVLPAVLSSVTAYTIFTLFFGSESIFGIPDYRFENALEVPFYALLAVVCSAAAWFYLKTFFFFKRTVFGRLKQKIGIMWTAAVGGLAMGLLGMAYPQLLSGGYGWLEMSVKGDLGVLFLLALFFGKTLATSLTIGSGLSGGMFAPALFAGGMAGGVVGQLGHLWKPEIVTQPGGYTLVGMAAFFAGVARAPIGPLIMVCEITQGYGLLAPLMLCSALCLVLCGNIRLYENQVENKFESPAHTGDATINILEGLQVEDFYTPGKVTVLEESVTLKALTDIISNTNELCFPVRNLGGDISGILAIQDVRNVLFENCLFELVLVRDLARKPVSLKPDVSLYDALMLFVDSDLSQIPVLDPEDERRVLGMLNREDVFQAYSRTIRELKKEEE